MNIFILSTDPEEAARQQIDKHVIKMPLETAQLLCSAFEPGEAPYKRTHYNHPCGVWTRASRNNALWLIEHGRALGEEYTRRYGKTHRSIAIIDWCADWLDRAAIPAGDLTPFAQAMPEEYKNADPVIAYRTYYRKAKAPIATWRYPAQPPAWWHESV